MLEPPALTNLPHNPFICGTGRGRVVGAPKRSIAPEVYRTVDVRLEGLHLPVAAAVIAASGRAIIGRGLNWTRVQFYHAP